MIRNILAIAGRPGLFKIVSQGNKMLIVEDLATGKRTPAYARDKVSSLGDISIYTVDGDKPLAEVFELVKAKTDGQPVDIKALVNGDGLRDFFGEVLPDFDTERVYTADIRKLLQWYNRLLASGITEFTDEEEATEENETAEAAESAD